MSASRDGARGRRLPHIFTMPATVGSLVLLLRLLDDRHTTGGEVLGLLVAASGVLIGLLSVVSLVVRTRRGWVAAVLAALWIGVALGGIGGYGDHAWRPEPGRVARDPRTPPPLAPLAFTVLGTLGAAGQVLRARAGSRDSRVLPGVGAPS